MLNRNNTSHFITKYLNIFIKTIINFTNLLKNHSENVIINIGLIISPSSINTPVIQKIILFTRTAKVNKKSVSNLIFLFCIYMGYFKNSIISINKDYITVYGRRGILPNDKVI